MKIIGCDLHAAQQTIAMLDRETRGSRREDVETRGGRRYGILRGACRHRWSSGIEATGSMGWFLRLLDELGITYRVGHPATIRKAETRKQKHDRRDADLLLRLLVEDRCE